MENHKTPLQLAAERGDTEAVRSILSNAECEVDAVSRTSHKTALHIACENGFIPIVQLLLDRRASLRRSRSDEDSREGYTALHRAAKAGSAATVELLIQRRADVHIVAFGRTALHVSCIFGHLEATYVLLRSGSDVNAAAVTTYSRGHTPLHYAAEYGSEEIVKLLLSYDANIGAVNKHGRTALHCAWESENHEIAELLLQIGGAFPSACSAAGASEVPCAVREDVVKMLLNCEAHINAIDVFGMTALHWSCHGKSPKVAGSLLTSGAAVNAAVIKKEDDVWDIAGSTPLHFTLAEENWRIGSRVQVDLVELLFQWGADVNAKDTVGRTPLTNYLRSSCDHENKQDILKLFAKHVAMMQAHNLFVDKSNLQALSDQEKLQDFITACKDEIENMRRIFIGDSSVTFFNVFTKGPVRLADYMANESILNAFESGDFECEFPIYAEYLRRQFVHGKQRLGLLRKTDSVLNVSNFRFVPYVCMRNLKQCLSNDDLKSILNSKARTESK